MWASLSSVVTLLVTTALFMFGHGVQITLIPLRSELEGFSDFMIGAGASFYSVGFVAGCMIAPYAILRAGHIRAFAAIISFSSAVALMHAIFVDPLAWVVFRTITGFCVAGFYITLESWLNDRATNETRGLVLSVYVVTLSLSIIAGQVTVAFGTVGDFRLFALASILVSFAVIPVAMTKSAQPAPITLVRLRPKRLYHSSPAAFVSILVVGLSIGALMNLSPLYATRTGYSEQFAAIFSAAIFAGGALLQWPLGRASDLVDRRIVLLVCAGAAFVASTGMLLAGALGAMIMLAFGMMVGGFTQPAYAIANAHAFDYVKPDDYVETSSGILMIYGVGAAISPVVVAALMQMSGPTALFWFTMAMNVIMGGFLLARMAMRSAVPEAEKEEFDYASTAPVVAMGVEEAWDQEDQLLVPDDYEPSEDAQSETVGAQN
ncbi:MAG TPA: MFS transporter [Afifellaceae bacterium]|nr:MFS transporter [Afifellaceae bacterium]